jgi:phosphatidylglycerol:prolipoprotein diacylglycerol transferase
MFLDINPIMFSIGNFSIRYYSFLILVGALIAILLLIKEGKRFGLSKDEVFDVAFWVIIIGIIGARLYYVVFNFEIYKNDLMSILHIWEGGLAIHGGIIFGGITLLLCCKKKGIDFIRFLDMAVVPMLLAQAIGRWGNFFNGEAHGMVTTFERLQSMHLPRFIINGMYIDGLYYEPTFLYESLWCLLGFIIIVILRRLKYIKKGMPTCFYLMWYSIGRFYIESLRTDSLMIAGFKAAQIVSIIMFIVGFVYLIFLFRKEKFEDLYNMKNEV